MANTIVTGTTIVPERGVAILTWSPITASGYGTWLSAPSHPDKTVQAFGTFSGSSSLTLRGSMATTLPAASGGNPFTMVSACGAALTFTTAGAQTLLDNANYVQVYSSGAMTGAGVTTTIRITCHSFKR